MVPMEDQLIRCGWAEGDQLLKAYHDTEWGVPLHDDDKLFAHFSLEVMQCGLSWLCVLKKRKALEAAFDDFVPSKIARYTEEDVERILAAPNVIRNRRKVEAVISNARAFLRLQEEEGSFDKWLWSFTEGRTIVNHYSDFREAPARTGLSDRIAAELKMRGFKFYGSVTVYAALQSVGVVDDHVDSCFRKSSS